MWAELRIFGPTFLTINIPQHTNMYDNHLHEELKKIAVENIGKLIN